METKICGKCKQEKLVSEFYKSKREGYRSRCKICSRLDVKEYINRPEVRELQKLYRREYYGRPDIKERDRVYYKEYRRRPDIKRKYFARQCLNHAIEAGKINREDCVLCGNPKGEGHHSNYNQPLVVIWLCRDCHKKLHW